MAKYNCLIVEDSRMMRQRLSLTLSRIKELQIVESDDGMDALKKLTEEKFDIAIIDINLPILDGLKLIKHIRQEPKHAKIPVVVVTTEGGQEDKDRAETLGIDVYLSKPVDTVELKLAVRRLLKL